MLAAAKKVKQTNKGYQMSPCLIEAMNRVKLWQEVLYRTRHRHTFTKHILKLADTLKIYLGRHQKHGIKRIRQLLSAAMKKKKWAQKMDAESRVEWLEKLAKEAQEDYPTTEWETIMARMIAAAKARQVNLRLSGLMKGERSGLDYIEVPDDKWYYDEKTEELYEFNDGLFCAHPCIDRVKKHFFTLSVLKKLPDSAKIVNASLSDEKLVLEQLWYHSKRLKEIYSFREGEILAHAQVDSDEMTFHLASTTGLLPDDCHIVHVEERAEDLLLDKTGKNPTWTKIIENNDIERWLLRRNKKHHQQVHDDNGPHVSEKLLNIFGDDGTGEEVDNLLSGNIDIDALDRD